MDRCLQVYNITMDDFSSATIRTEATQATPTDMMSKDSPVDDLMVSYFRLNPNNINNKTLEKINEIGQWVRSKAKDEIDIIKTLKDIKYRLGSPKLGVSDIDHLYTYITLRRQSESAEMRAKAMEV